MKHLTHRVDRVDPREYSLESQEVSEERSVARDVIYVASLLAVIWCLFAIALPTVAHADEGNTHTVVVAEFGDTFLVTTKHSVVVSSTLRHCPLEDGGLHLKRLGPCTWNVGSTADGNGYGLAYVLISHHRAEYLWTHNPAINGWHWVHGRGPGTADCVVKAGVNRARCSDGTYLR